MLRNDAVRRELRGIAIALLLVAATTVVAFVLIRYLEVRRGSVIYLLPVMLAGWHLGLLPALVAAVAGVLWSGYFFFSPFYSYYLARPTEILNLVLFMVVAVVTSHLANSMKRQTELARKRENEMSYLYAFSRRLAAAPSAEDIYTAIEEHLANLVRRKVILFGAAAGRDERTLPDERTVPERVRAEIERTRLDLGHHHRRRRRQHLAGPPRVAKDRRLRRHRYRSRQRAGGRHRRRPRSGSTTCSPTRPPRSSGSMSRARSTTPRCARRPSCCGRR